MRDLATFGALALVTFPPPPILLLGLQCRNANTPSLPPSSELSEATPSKTALFASPGNYLGLPLYPWFKRRVLCCSPRSNGKNATKPAVLKKKKNILLQEITDPALRPNVSITSKLRPMCQATAPTKHGGLKYIIMQSAF